MDCQRLLDKIYREKGIDFNQYRESTLERRINRRIQFDGASSLDEYISMLDKDYHLYWRLISDIFIGVTDFFRDSEIWEVVRGQVLPSIVSNSSPLGIRIWSAGCSTGEETYSIAIAISELIEHEKLNMPVSIIGTDIMDDKLEVAVKGEYFSEKAEKIDEKLKEKYFFSPSLFASSFVVSSKLKQIVSFKKYDLVHDVALHGFDMLVCRNVLIYFQRSLQGKVIKKFFDALKPGGILWLGKSETVWGECEKLFEPVFRKERIYRKLGTRDEGNLESLRKQG